MGLKCYARSDATSIVYKKKYNGYITTDDCILLENEQNYIKLKCEMLYSGENETQTKIRKYELSTDKNPYTYDENEQEIVETILENETGEKFSSKVWLYINLNE